MMSAHTLSQLSEIWTPLNNTSAISDRHWLDLNTKRFKRTLAVILFQSLARSKHKKVQKNASSHSVSVIG